MEEEKTQQLPSVGRLVHYVLESGPHAGEHRPAIIVKVWGEYGAGLNPLTACQLQVFTDEGNDALPGVIWKTSRQQGEGPGSWHWPEYVPSAERPATAEQVANIARSVGDDVGTA